MLAIKYKNKILGLVNRCGSFSICKVILESIGKDNHASHPIGDLFELGLVLSIDMAIKTNLEMGVLVRDPVQRFRSACSRTGVLPQEAIKTINSSFAEIRKNNRVVNGMFFWSLQEMGFISSRFRYFLFPDDIKLCAEWLGLPTPVPHENAEPEEKKPVLTPEQELAVRLAYADDIALWESLQ